MWLLVLVFTDSQVLQIKQDLTAEYFVQVMRQLAVNILPGKGKMLMSWVLCGSCGSQPVSCFLPSTPDLIVSVEGPVVRN